MVLRSNVKGRPSHWETSLCAQVSPYMLYVFLYVFLESKSSGDDPKTLRYIFTVKISSYDTPRTKIWNLEEDATINQQTVQGSIICT